AEGLRSPDPDTDDDGIGDADERDAPDADGDGVPSFFDTDSDGDGILDGDETTADDDRDGIPAFVDLDSDGAAPPDSGADLLADLDADAIADYRDADDDGDGLPDASDAMPRVPLPSDADPTRGVAILAVETVIGTDVAPAAIVSGETLRITGYGFGTTAGTRVVFGAGLPSPQIVTPSSVSATEVLVLAPPEAEGPVRVVRAGVASSAFPADAIDLDAFEPLLFAQASLLEPGYVVLRGRNVEGLDGATVDGMPVQRFDFGSGPAIGESGLTRVSTPFGDSNPVAIRAADETYASILLPSGSTVDESRLVVSSPLGDAPPSGGPHRVPILRRRTPELITATATDGIGAGSDCLTLAGFNVGGGGVPLTALSTAVALALMHTHGFARVGSRSYTALSDRLAALTEVGTLASLIDARLMTSACPLEATTSALDDAILAAVAAAETSLTEGLADGSLAGPRPPEPPRPMAIRIATITPDEIADVSVLQTQGTGNVEVENDTTLLLSARITAEPDGRLLVPHISGYFDRNV
ncbi:MAG: hypothetical protein K8H88_28860, partial [Sandaracinaceae bacterium]|nr:hypothetical protein [Sandaracinaceae bacterium]